MGVTLITEIAASIGIFEIETEVQSFTGVHSKLSINMVLTIGLVTAVVVENTGIWRQGVHKQEILRTFLYEAIWLCEYKVICSGAVDEYTAQP